MEDMQTWRRQWNMRRRSVGRNGAVSCRILWRESCGTRLNRGVSQVSSCASLRRRKNRDVMSVKPTQVVRRTDPQLASD